MQPEKPLFQCIINPRDSSSLIRHRLEVEIPRGKFIKISFILKGESAWKF